MPVPEPGVNVWDHVVDAISDDKEFMQQAIEESKSVENLQNYKKKSSTKKHSHHKNHNLVQTKEEDDDQLDEVVSLD